MLRRLLTLLVLAAASLAAPDTYAYLDPASGSMFLQLLLGGVAAVGVAVKLFWHKILGLFGAAPPAEDTADTELDDTPDDAA